MGKIEAAHTALLITGTIVPNSVYVAHADPRQRRDEYFDALKYYSERFGNYHLYFLENSGYDFGTDAAFTDLLRSRGITLLQFGRSEMYDRGKGYQEFEMLDAAVAQLPPGILSVVKITGRYKVVNLLRLLEDECRGFLGDSQKKPRVVQTNVFACTRSFYEDHIRGTFREADDSAGLFIEKVLYKHFFTGEATGLKLFRANPVIEGISGSYGGTLRRNPLKQRLRNLERKVLRTFGIPQFLMEY